MNKTCGFTLIELLVVIAIMSVSLGIVGPLMSNQADKTRAIAEFNQAETYMRHSSKVAFLRGQSIRIVLDGKQLTRFIGDAEQQVVYEHLFFPVQQVQINANGFYSQQEIVVQIGKRQEHIMLNPTDS